MSRAKRRRRNVGYIAAAVMLIAVLCASAAWLAHRAKQIQSNLVATSELVPKLKTQLLSGDMTSADKTVNSMRSHTAAARSSASDPVWKSAAALPWLGPNFSAISEVATTADDVVNRAAAPLTGSVSSLSWDDLAPANGEVDLGPLGEAAPKIVSASHTIQLSYGRLSQIDTSVLLPAVSDPLREATRQLGSFKDSLSNAADAATLLPSMMGGEGPRNYLLLIQNNAEIRATGGIPGALAVLTVDHGKISVSSQSSAASLGIFNPPLSVDAEQERIYTSRMGRYVQDVNLSPNFPTAAETAKRMWETKMKTEIDGVISIDPVALSFVLQSTGPLVLSGDAAEMASDAGLPLQLTSENVVQTLLSESYSKISRPSDQDVFFAAVANEVFAGVTSGKGDPKKLLSALAKGSEEDRILVWSADKDEQAVLAQGPMSGSVVGPAVPAAAFGVYFNDGTGAKMDYYMKRTVQLVQECTGDDYGQVRVRITSTNTAPADAAAVLPAYVTGNGAFGVPAGTVQTNVIAYGPVQAYVETAMVDGKKTDFAAHIHGNRPVGFVTVTLAPGQSSTVELTFGKIVQHTEPNVVVTPTVQPVKDVILGTQRSECVPGK